MFSQDLLGVSRLYSDIKAEINAIEPAGQNRLVLLSDVCAPKLSCIVSNFLNKFCMKTCPGKLPTVYIYFDEADQRDYNFYCDGENILLGQGLLKILLWDNKFEKYFEAILAHEFSHFTLKHMSKSTLDKEIEANNFAFSLIDNPYDLIDAMILQFLALMFAVDYEKLGCEKDMRDEMSELIAMILFEFTLVADGFSSFYSCVTWDEVDFWRSVAMYGAIGKSNAKDIFYAQRVAANLVNFSHNFIDSSSFKNNLFRFCLRSVICCRKLFSPESHPAPQKLLELCRRNQKAL